MSALGIPDEMVNREAATIAKRCLDLVESLQPIEADMVRRVWQKQLIKVGGSPMEEDIATTQLYQFAMYGIDMARKEAKNRRLAGRN